MTTSRKEKYIESVEKRKKDFSNFVLRVFKVFAAVHVVDFFAILFGGLRNLHKMTIVGKLIVHCQYNEDGRQSADIVADWMQSFVSDYAITLQEGKDTKPLETLFFNPQQFIEEYVKDFKQKELKFGVDHVKDAKKFHKNLRGLAMGMEIFMHQLIRTKDVELLKTFENEFDFAVMYCPCWWDDEQEEEPQDDDY